MDTFLDILIFRRLIALCKQATVTDFKSVGIHIIFYCTLHQTPMFPTGGTKACEFIVTNKLKMLRFSFKSYSVLMTIVRDIIFPLQVV